MGTKAHVVFVAIGSILVAAAPASAHLFNHQDRHEVCDLHGAPQAHALADGHAHWHHTAPAAAGHTHGGAWFEAGHTHPDVFHDPCDQAGMLRFHFGDAPPLGEVTLPAAVIAPRQEGLIPGVLRDAGEALQLPVPTITMQDTLVIRGDAGLSRFPGSGTPEDPYVIEGYHIRNTLAIVDTTKCVVVRHNVVYNNLVRGPLVDPALVVDLAKLVEDLRARVADAQARLDTARATLATNDATLQELRIELDARKAALDETVAQWRALSAAADADGQRTREARAEARTRAVDVRAASADLRAALAERNVRTPAPPPSDAEPDDPRLVAFVSQVEEAARTVASDDRIASLQARVETTRAAHEKAADTLTQARATQAVSREAREAFRPTLDAARAEHAAWLDAAWRPAVAQRDADAALVQDARSALAATRASLDAARAKAAQGAFEHLGTIYETLDQLAQAAIDRIPRGPQGVTGRLVLDWNGQCVHVYNNVIEDLRVNQNNARTGYATGGLIENNRIFVVGQIRHYDGEFRENEVGGRIEIVDSLAGRARARALDVASDAYGPKEPAGGAPPQAKLGRAINADGFNEAWMHDNVIYGSVDLDFHGHHHAPGFFARESHYHGDLVHHAYMVDAATGKCAHPTPGKPGPLDPIAPDVLAQPPGCLPHHDHAKRWTSVRFERNVILDPLGYGLRYEDQAHAGDDRIANSESMAELNLPHFHRTHVVLAENLILGSLWADVFNADGIELWDDDFSPVRRDPTGAILDVLEHAGARIVNSHPHRNEGWLDIQKNAVFLVDKADAVRAGHDAWSAYQLNDVKEARIDVAANRAYLLGQGFNASVSTPAALVAKLRDVAALPPEQAQEAVDAWGGSHPRRADTTALLVRGAADGLVATCGNAMPGFARGLVATQRIRPDVGFLDCSDNVWHGSAVVTTPYPRREGSVFDPLREIGEGTPVERHAHSMADHLGVIARR